jgi:cytochrome c-type biogenesis protein CcmH
MIAFVLLALLLTVLALLPVVLPLFRTARARGQEREALNVALFQERRDELEQELGDDAISADQYEAARLELERDLLLNTGNEGKTEQRPSRRLALVLGLAVPLLAGLLYVQLGATDFIDLPEATHAAADEPVVDTDMATLTQQLADRLKREPKDAQGWILLGRSLTMQERYAEAGAAYEEGLKNVGDHPDLLTSYAEILAMQQGDMKGRPQQMVRRALELDPDAQGALWLAGIAAFQAEDYAAAIGHWKRLEAMLPPQGEAAGLVRDNLAEARARSGEPQALAEAVPPLRLRISLAPALAAQAQPDQVLFILARPPEGGMPIAAVRRQVRDLPLNIVLDESAQLTAGRSLADFAQVEVVARVSRSGSAGAVSGDLEGSAVVDTRATAPVVIEIGRVRP